MGASFVAHYNDVRLHGALGYITPADKLAGLETVIFAERDRKLEAARALCVANARHRGAPSVRYRSLAKANTGKG